MGNYYNSRKKKTSKKNVYSARRPIRYQAKHSNNTYKIQNRKINKKKVFVVIILPIIVIFFIINKANSKNSQEVNSEISKQTEETTQSTSENTTGQTNAATSSTGTTNTSSTNTSSTVGGNENNETPNVDVTTDWRIRLANYDHILPEDFEVELADIDSTRQFDARAIKYLKDMINDMKKDGHTSIWVQSSYRSVARQKELYENSINKYLKQGKTQEEAEKLTDEYINKPGSSDHNLGLAVDFNYVDNTFADTDEYQWLLENAENYGFILRYPKDKEDITKIAYESWHWRYVGEEHAKKMNELNMCLEEYVEYLENG